MENKEIERVFIKSGEISYNEENYTEKISDIYFTRFLRVRRCVDDVIGLPEYICTCKFNTLNKLIRHEFEIELPDFIGEFLFKHVRKQMHKERTHSLVDVFQDDNYLGYLDFQANHYMNVASIPDLIEIEFDSEEQAILFNLEEFNFLGAEVSGDDFFRNYNLYNRCRAGVKWYV